jgi:hypothetical protein
MVENQPAKKAACSRWLGYAVSRDTNDLGLEVKRNRVRSGDRD